MQSQLPLDEKRSFLKKVLPKFYYDFHIKKCTFIQNFVGYLNISKIKFRPRLKSKNISNLQSPVI